MITSTQLQLSVMFIRDLLAWAVVIVFGTIRIMFIDE